MGIFPLAFFSFHICGNRGERLPAGVVLIEKQAKKILTRTQGALCSSIVPAQDFPF
jgi:hypothetical protein